MQIAMRMTIATNIQMSELNEVASGVANLLLNMNHNRQTK